MNAIEIKNLTKCYGETVAVNNLTLNVKHGELFALLGVNGAGKTTTVKTLACLTKPTEGDAFLLGKSVTFNSSEVKSFIALSPQETAIAPALTVKENLELICGLYGLKKQEMLQKIECVALKLGLEGVLNKKSSKLSGGWKRRLSIAMALISDPKILFLDEPTLGLDVIVRSELWDIIRALKGKVTVILTTHYMEEAEALADRVGIMKEGKLLICDTVENIKEFAKTNSFEQAFINIVKGEIK